MFVRRICLWVFGSESVCVYEAERFFGRLEVRAFVFVRRVCFWKVRSKCVCVYEVDVLVGVLRFFFVVVFLVVRRVSLGFICFLFLWYL